MKSKLKEHAIEVFSHVIQYYHAILDDFPEDKLNEKVGEADPPMKILLHVGNTGSFWMKNYERPFDRSIRIESKALFFEKLEYQLKEFKKWLDDDEQLYYKSESDSKPRLSVPWIMIRTANHAMHHGSMLVKFRHIFGLGGLPQGSDALWAKTVDLPGIINYSEIK